MSDNTGDPPPQPPSFASDAAFERMIDKAFGDDETADLETRISNRLVTDDYVSFAELAKSFPEEFHADNGVSLNIRRNLIIWSGITERGARAIGNLLSEKQIACYPAQPLIYLCDGLALNLPIARRIRDYAKPHWLPVSFRHTSRLTAKERREQHWMFVDGLK